MENPGYSPDEKDVKVSPAIVETGDDQRKRNKVTEEDKFSIFRLCNLRQVACATTISSALYVISFLIGSTSMLPVILNENAVQKNYTSEDLKWLASAPIFLSILGNGVAAFFTEQMGPTLVFRISLFLCLLLYLVAAAWPTLTFLWISRIGLWVVVGTFDITCIPLISLLTEPKMRGLCGALPELTTAFGVLFVFLTFSFLPGQYAVLCNAVPVFLGFIGSFFVPESPNWLIKNGREDEAAAGLLRVLGPTKKQEQSTMLEDLLEGFRNSQPEKSSSNKFVSTFKNQIRLLKHPKNWKPILLATGIFGFRELGGHNVIYFYALSIFQKANIAVDIFLCTIIVGIAKVISTLMSTIFQDKLGRRTMLIGSTFISVLSLMLSGLVMSFGAEVQTLKFIPMLGIIVFILMSGVGMGPVPFILVGELIPSEVKFCGTAIVFSLFNFYQFVIVNVIPSFLEMFSVGVIFVSFSVINLVIVIVLYFILPETKHKTIAELDNLYK